MSDCSHSHPEQCPQCERDQLKHDLELARKEIKHLHYKLAEDVRQIIHQSGTIDKLLDDHIIDDREIVRLPAEGIDLKDLEKIAIASALKVTKWSQKEAAKMLGVTPRVMHYKCKKYGFKHSSWRGNYKKK